LGFPFNIYVTTEDNFKLIITPLAGNIEPSNWDIMGGAKSTNNKSKMAAAAI